MKKILFFISFFVISLRAEINFELLEHSQIEDTTWNCIDEGVRTVYGESTSTQEIGRILERRKAIPENVLVAREDGRYVGHMFYAIENEQYLRMGSVGAVDMTDKLLFVSLARKMLAHLESQFPQQIISGCMGEQREKLLPLFSAAQFIEDSSIEIDPKRIREDFHIDITKNYYWFRRPRN